MQQLINRSINLVHFLTIKGATGLNELKARPIGDAIYPESAPHCEYGSRDSQQAPHMQTQQEQMISSDQNQIQQQQQQHVIANSIAPDNSFNSDKLLHTQQQTSDPYSRYYLNDASNSYLNYDTNSNLIKPNYHQMPDQQQHHHQHHIQQPLTNVDNLHNYGEVGNLDTYNDSESDINYLLPSAPPPPTKCQVDTGQTDQYYWPASRANQQLNNTTTDQYVPMKPPNDLDSSSYNTNYQLQQQHQAAVHYPIVDTNNHHQLPATSTLASDGLVAHVEPNKILHNGISHVDRLATSTTAATTTFQNNSDDYKLSLHGSVNKSMIDCYSGSWDHDQFNLSHQQHLDHHQQQSTYHHHHHQHSVDNHLSTHLNQQRNTNQHHLVDSGAQQFSNNINSNNSTHSRLDDRRCDGNSFQPIHAYHHHHQPNNNYNQFYQHHQNNNNNNCQQAPHLGLDNGKAIDAITSCQATYNRSLNRDPIGMNP